MYSKAVDQKTFGEVVPKASAICALVGTPRKFPKPQTLNTRSVREYVLPVPSSYRQAY
jgi:hypothetical protein